MIEADSSGQLLADYLLDATIQQRFMAPCEQDQEFRRNAGQILWAVDTDVISLYSQPDMEASWKDGRLGYGRVFRRDDDHLTSAISVCLTDFIFYRLSPDIPLLVIPPIDAEIQIFLQSLTQRFGREPSMRSVQVNLEKVSKLVEELQQASRTTGSTGQDLIDRALQLTYLEEGPEATFRRLWRLLDIKRVAAPDVVRTHRQLADTAFLAVLDPLSEDIFEFAELREDWFRLLRKIVKPASRLRTTAVERDASAMARLTWWNRKLEQHNARIVYITGSRALFEAGWAYEAEAGIKFAERYLRHPRAFLAIPEVLDNKTTDKSADQKRRFKEFIETFLTNFNDRGDVLDDNDRFELTPLGMKVVRSVLAQQPQLAEDFKSKWDEYASDVRTDYHPPDSLARRLTQELGYVPGAQLVYKSLDDVRRRFEAEIEKIIDETWDACFRAATEAGYRFLFYDQALYYRPTDEAGTRRSRVPTRVVPPLFFETWYKTSAFINKIIHWHLAKDFNAKEYHKGLEDIRSEDPSGYAYYLAHAALFAGREQWSVAAILAARAIAKSNNRKPGESPTANGREAYHLMAFCSRHAAKKLADLDRLASFVSHAEDIYKSEKNIVEKIGPSFGFFDVVDERFEMERLAIAMTYLIFRRFIPVEGRPIEIPSPIPDATWLSDCDALSDQLWQLRILVVGRLYEIERKVSIKVYSDEITRESAVLDRIRNILTRLEVRICNNIVALWLSMQDSSAIARPKEHVADAYSRLERNARDVAYTSIEVSHIVEIVRKCAAVFFEESYERRNSKAREAQSLLNECENDRVAFSLFDEARLRHFRYLIERDIEARTT